MTNIIKFPKNSDGLPTTAAEAEQALREVRAEYIDEVIETIMDRVGGDLVSFGFGLSDKREHQKDWFFLRESMEGMLYRYAKLHHHLHPIVNESIRFPDEEEIVFTEEPKKKKRSRKKKEVKKDEVPSD